MTLSAVKEPGPATSAASPPVVPPAGGLSSAEARRRLAEAGPNAMPDTSAHPLRRALGKFWAPVPWMLEAAVVLECTLGKFVEASIIAGLLVFNAALFAYSPGHMLQNKWRVALYLDERGTAEQQEALGKIFSGQAGGPLSALGPMIGEVVGVKPVAIEYQLEGKRRRLHIPNVADMEIEALQGQDGGEVTISNHPLTPVPGFAAVVGKSKEFRFTDYGFTREISDRNGFYAPFAYHG